MSANLCFFPDMGMKKKDSFVVIGAGLPRTGTLSTRTALIQLLGGKCYHMQDVFEGDQETLEFWTKATNHSDDKIPKEEWVQFLEGRQYRAGVDFPIALFYK